MLMTRLRADFGEIGVTAVRATGDADADLAALSGCDQAVPEGPAVDDGVLPAVVGDEKLAFDFDLHKSALAVDCARASSIEQLRPASVLAADRPCRDGILGSPAKGPL